MTYTVLTDGSIEEFEVEADRIDISSDGKFVFLISETRRVAVLPSDTLIAVIESSAFSECADEDEE